MNAPHCEQAAVVNDQIEMMQFFPPTQTKIVDHKQRAQPQLILTRLKLFPKMEVL